MVFNNASLVDADKVWLLRYREANMIMCSMEVSLKATAILP